MVIEYCDELVRDPAIRLANFETHLAASSGGDDLFETFAEEYARYADTTPAFFSHTGFGRLNGA